MAVAVAPVVVELAAEAGGGGEVDGGGAPLEVAGNDVKSPVLVDGKGAPPVGRVPAAITAGREEKGKYAEGVKWLGHYSSAQDILLVGDGDFSFSLALATAFGSGANLVATSLDTYEDLRGKYSKAESNLTELKRLGAMMLHGVDTKKMKSHPVLKNRKFDRIVFNLPHAGFKGKEDDLHMINSHRELVLGFFLNASRLLRPYCEIHISHKTGGAYDRWGLEDLASEASLVLVDKVAFQQEDYPGYNQKRGDSARCDEAFDLGTCFTFKFRIRDFKNWKKLDGNITTSISFLGIMTLATERGPFHPFPPDEAWHQQHLPPPVNEVHVRDLYFHQQGNTRPMLRSPGPLVNALLNPGRAIHPPTGRIPFPDLLAPQEESWYQHRPTADALERDHSCLAWEHQQRLQREYEMQRHVMPVATSLRDLALLEHRHKEREGVQKERLRRMVGFYGSMR